MMTRLIALFAALLTCLMIPMHAAQADDVASASQSVARVLALTEHEDGRSVSLGTAFAIAPNRVITNAHVVLDAANAPDGSRILVVPSVGKEAVPARIVAIDQGKDLALLEFSGATMKPMTLYMGSMSAGARVFSLGYPGNVDRATMTSEMDYLVPRPPLRSSGDTSGFSTLNGLNVLVHEAPISRGNSGGPVVDPCGRVLGVNSAITDGDGNNSTFAFAIASTELAGFLSRAQQSVKIERGTCRTSEQRAADAKAKNENAAAAQAETEAELAARNRAMAHERLNIRTREKRDSLLAASFALALLAMVALNGALWIASRGHRQWAFASAIAGGFLIAIAIIVYTSRPSEMTLYAEPFNGVSGATNDSLP